MVENQLSTVRLERLEVRLRSVQDAGQLLVDLLAILIHIEGLIVPGRIFHHHVADHLGAEEELQALFPLCARNPSSPAAPAAFPTGDKTWEYLLALPVLW